MSFVVILLILSAALFDWKTRKLPVEPLMIAAIVFLLYRAFLNEGVSSLEGLLLGGGFIGVQVLISRGKWMGMGDVYLMAAIGAYLGLRDTAVALYLTYVIGGVIAVILLGFGIFKRKTRIPFAPFIAIGSIGALLYGEPIARWFLDRI